MKKVLGILALLVLVASSVMAGTAIIITPNDVAMGQTDTVNVDVCVEQTIGGSTSPVVGMDLSITDVCQDGDNNGGCGDAADTSYPAEFTAVVTSTPTDSTGCGVVKLTTTNAQGGTFAYEVNGVKGSVEVQEWGTAYVPEFTTIGSALVLLGAGWFIYRKQRK